MQARDGISVVRQLALTLSFGLLFSPACVKAAESVWKSEHHPVQVRYSPTWVYLKGTNSKDTADELLAAFLNRAEKSACLVRITKDVPKEDLGDEAYITALKKQHLATGSHTLIDEGEAELQETKFQRLRFSVNGTTGPVVTHLYVRRDGKRAITLTFTFPENATKSKTDSLPEVFTKLRLSFEEPGSKASDKP